jgi:hypothetical protein
MARDKRNYSTGPRKEVITMAKALTDREAYDLCMKTFESWVNWEKPTDCVGLLIGLGDYYCEIKILEDVLDIPQADRFDLARVVKW